MPNNRLVGKLISLTVLISSSTGEGSVQDIGNLAIRGSEWTDRNTISWMKSNILAYCNNNDNQTFYDIQETGWTIKIQETTFVAHSTSALLLLYDLFNDVVTHLKPTVADSPWKAKGRSVMRTLYSLIMIVLVRTFHLRQTKNLGYKLFL